MLTAKIDNSTSHHAIKMYKYKLLRKCIFKFDPDLETSEYI